VPFGREDHAGLGSFQALEGLGFCQYTAVFVVLGAALSLVYFLLATVGFGGEWTWGYAWGTAGGGWEYVMLLLMVSGGVMMTGAGKFSLDGWWACAQMRGVNAKGEKGKVCPPPVAFNLSPIANDLAATATAT